eukprot:2690588-Rhodomonas_salina.1
MLLVRGRLGHGEDCFAYPQHRVVPPGVMEASEHLDRQGCHPNHAIEQRQPLRPTPRTCHVEHPVQTPVLPRHGFDPQVTPLCRAFPPLPHLGGLQLMEKVYALSKHSR